MINIADSYRTEDPTTNSMLDKVEVYEHDGTTMDHIVIGGVKINCHEMSRLYSLLEARIFGRGVLNDKREL